MTTAAQAIACDTSWQPVCHLGRLVPDRGVAVLVRDQAVALFRLSTGELFALNNVDPFCGASVLSRGIVGDAAGVPTVASPMYKQRFALPTGLCLDDPSVAVGVHEVRATGDVVGVRLSTSGAAMAGGRSRTCP